MSNQNFVPNHPDRLVITTTDTKIYRRFSEMMRHEPFSTRAVCKMLGHKWRVEHLEEIGTPQIVSYTITLVALVEIAKEAKPHLGRIKDWVKIPYNDGLGYRISGTFLDHPYIWRDGFTSAVVKHDEATGEIETKNSRYNLVSEGEPSETSMRSHWPMKGDKVTFLGRNGYDNELEEARKIFAIDGTYEVADCEIGDWRSFLSFVGIPGRFNSVMFEKVK